ncbi:MAG: CopG family transcriptional regulator [Kiritimatiellia bacterium]
MNRRIGFIGIIIEDRECVATVNDLLSESSSIILARVGLPQRERGVSVITLVVEATTDEVGLLTGRLGAIKGISVKSGLSKTANPHLR